jgi:hypothetical protein
MFLRMGIRFAVGLGTMSLIEKSDRISIFWICQYFLYYSVFIGLMRLGTRFLLHFLSVRAAVAPIDSLHVNRIWINCDADDVAVSAPRYIHPLL